VVGVTVTDEQRRADLRRHKALATGLLLVAAVVYAVTLATGSDGWVRAGAEAALVGGLADWFAVTALFRRPLGLPIPHTAIIPTRKDQLGQGLSDFVGTQFLNAEVVGERLATAQVPARVGTWLAVPANAERVAAELATAVAGVIGVLREDEVRAAIASALEGRLEQTRVGPVLGGVLGPVVADGAHHGLVDVVATRVHAWLRDNREQVERVVADQAPDWSPRFVDRKVAAKVYDEVLRVAANVDLDPRHPLRGTLDGFLARLARDLRDDAETGERTDAFVRRMAARPEVRDALHDLVSSGRRLLLDLVEDPSSDLRRRAVLELQRLGERVGTDPELRARLDGYLLRAVLHVVEGYRDELTRVITDTVERWDGPETARRIELQVGRDLQYIRLNGTVVGALAGLAIHAVSTLA
jgi:uncharacterized membrane-anchored protein YjiN (DUF445 family)